MKLIPFIVLVLFLSCGTSDNNEITLAQVGDEKLSQSTLSDILPKGLSAADSATFCNAFVQQWIQDQVLKLERFKNQLLVQGLREKVISEGIGANQNTKTDSTQMGMSEEVILESKKWTIWQQYQTELIKKYEAEGLIKKP
jgi:hypothetical protein